MPSDSSNNNIARDALANIRRILKDEINPVTEVKKGSNLIAAHTQLDSGSSERYLGTVDELVHSIESASKRAPDGTEFWSSRTLMSILGYANSSWDIFKDVILKAQYACESSDQRIDSHFSKIIISSASDKYDDIEVTRYGAYLIAQNGDSRKRQIAFAQTYFATQTRKQEIQNKKHSCTKDEQRRLDMRDKISEHNKALADAAREAGIDEPVDFAKFQNFGYRGLYNGLDARGIRNAKKLSEKAKILDYMDITELAANFFRATQAEDKLRREKIYGKDEANAAHYEVGCKVRKAIKDIGGTMPEKIQPAENLEDIRKRIAKLRN